MNSKRDERDEEKINVGLLCCVKTCLGILFFSVIFVFHPPIPILLGLLKYFLSPVSFFSILGQNIFSIPVSIVFWRLVWVYFFLLYLFLFVLILLRVPHLVEAFFHRTISVFYSCFYFSVLIQTFFFGSFVILRIAFVCFLFNSFSSLSTPCPNFFYNSLCELVMTLHCLETQVKKVQTQHRILVPLSFKQHYYLMYISLMRRFCHS